MHVLHTATAENITKYYVFQENITYFKKILRISRKYYVFQENITYSLHFLKEFKV